MITCFVFVLQKLYLHPYNNALHGALCKIQLDIKLHSNLFI